MMGWIRESPWLMQVLREVRDVAGPGVAVAAGVMRSLAWSRLHGQSVLDWERSWRVGASGQAEPSLAMSGGNPVRAAQRDRPADIDVVFHDVDHPPGHDALVARALAQRTLTKLYNQRPAWLAQAHAQLNAAVAAAYGWADYTPELQDDEILRRLLALNLQRAAGGDT